MSGVKSVVLLNQRRCINPSPKILSSARFLNGPTAAESTTEGQNHRLARFLLALVAVRTISVGGHRENQHSFPQTTNYLQSTMRSSLFTLTTVFLLEECSLVSATAGPVFAEFCPTIMDGWLCNRNPTGHWLDNTCGEDSEANAQLEILAEFYFTTGNRASSGPLFEMGWLSDCEFCEWEGISCNEAGEVTAIEVGTYLLVSSTS